MTQRTYSVPFRGGMDLVTPAKSVNPGRVLVSKNYEPRDEGGYRRILGYERFDGLPSPTEASYWILQYDGGTGAELFAENIITGGTSGATAEILSIDLDSGAWSNNAAGEMRLFNLTGTFVDNEALTLSGTRCLANGITGQRSATTNALDETYHRAAIEARRADISIVPGGDEINGVWIYNGDTYAVRDNIGAVTLTGTGIDFTSPDTIGDTGSGMGIFTAGDRIIISGSTGNSVEWDVDTAVAGALTVSRSDERTVTTEAAGPSVTISKLDHAELWKSSSSGWTEVDLGSYLDFSTGTAEFTEGSTVTGSPSAATAVIVGVGVTSGSWNGGDAAGRLYVKTVTGTFTASDTLADDGTTPGVGNCDSAAVAVELPRGGKYDFQNYNFFGSSGSIAMWGCNGVGRAFRVSTAGFAHVHITGLTNVTDTPEHLEAHKKHLFLSIGSSLQHSSTGFPMVWSAITGATELATGGPIVSIENQTGDILGIFNRNRTYLLYGDDVENWDMVNYSLEKGAIEWTVQDLGHSIYHDDRGIHTLKSTDAYGDMKAAAISTKVDPFVQEAKSKIVDSVRIKSTDQYRVFYNDNSGLLVRMEGNQNHFMPFTWDHRVYSICAEEDSTGLERVFFGSNDGYVYEAEKGESFDGELIEYNLRTVFCHCGSPRQEKRFHKVTIEIDCADLIGLSYSPDFSYGSTGQPDAYTAQAQVATGGLWGVDLWSNFIWDGALLGEAQAHISGVGINIGMLMQGSSNYERVHVIEGLTYNYSPRGVKR
jgi:hypothetical protein